MADVFDVDNISFDYEGIPALRDFSLKIMQGERIALLGANGSGKSTLLRILDALYFSANGAVRFFGQELSERRIRDQSFSQDFRKRVALVFQNPDVQLFNPTVFDEVAYAPLQLQWGRADLVRRVEETLSAMSLLHLRDRTPYRLSGGEKKRVALASVLILDPEVLLLDEPTVMLDPKSQSLVVDLIQQWKGSTKTVITATHQLEIVEDIADRVVVMDAGTILATGTPHGILSNTELLLRANLAHAHRHSHGSVVHSHPHRHGHAHSHDGQEHE